MKQAVLGLGNLLLGDEGVGVHSIRALSDLTKTTDVDLVDVGTAILDAIPILDRADRIVVIDAVCAGEEPGTVYRMTLDDVEASPVIGSMHGFDLCRVMSLCRRADRPEVVVIGVEPDRIQWSMELSPAVASALPDVVLAVRRELEKVSEGANGLEEDIAMPTIKDHGGRRRTVPTHKAVALAATVVLTASIAAAARPDDRAPGAGTAAPHPFAGDLRALQDDRDSDVPQAPAKARVDGFGKMTTVEGIGFSGATPADTVGAVGAGRYLQLVSGQPSSRLVVRDTATAAVIAGPVTLSDLWIGGGPCAEGWGQPGVAFDRSSDRWIISERGPGNHLCLYVSESDDPVAGGWTGYDIETPGFPDRPRLAVWPDSFVVTTSEAAPAVYVLERSAMLAGEPVSWRRIEVAPLEGFGTQALTPAGLSLLSDTAPAPRPVVGRQVDGQAHGGVDRLELWEVEIDWQAPSSASLLGPTSVAVSPFDSELCGLGPRPCVPQPGTSQLLDPGRESLASLELAVFDDHIALVGSFTVDGDGGDRAAVRWFELRSTGGSWTVHDEGLHAPDSAHRWLPAAAVDRQGHLALVMSASNPAGNGPSVRLTGRSADDPPSAMTIGEIELRTGDGPQTDGTSPDRWGAWSSLVLDASDGCTFWASAPYTVDGVWGTVIAAFAFDGCGDVSSDAMFADGFETGDTQAWGDVTP